MSERVDADAVRSGATRAVAICLPVTVLANVVIDDDATGGAAAVFYVAVLLGFALGGATAARRDDETPYSSGAVAALVAFVLIAVVSVVVNVVQGDTVNVVSLVFNGLLAYGAGLLGAALVARRKAAA